MIEGHSIQGDLHFESWSMPFRVINIMTQLSERRRLCTEVPIEKFLAILCFVTPSPFSFFAVKFTTGAITDHVVMYLSSMMTMS